ncbi:hypothetical protein BKA70DRAFT_1426597 [Coprinopsis sp. MPI-PUGE-AT-0042]|nr:hypothetical protein BKA70DRAFT_1426597 [Coprinopsis sp. MPI-PUGE-AT-0042]
MNTRPSNSEISTPRSVWLDALDCPGNFGPIPEPPLAVDDTVVAPVTRRTQQLVENPTFTLRARDLRTMDTEDIIKEAVMRGSRIQALERRILSLQRDFLKQRNVSKGLVSTLNEIYQLEHMRAGGKGLHSTETARSATSV